MFNIFELFLLKEILIFCISRVIGKLFVNIAVEVKKRFWLFSGRQAVYLITQPHNHILKGPCVAKQGFDELCGFTFRTFVRLKIS